MMTSKVLNLLLSIVVVILSAIIAFSANSKKQEDSADLSEMVLNNIMTRASVRSYDSRSVEDWKIEKILKAGMAAPSAHNKQPWAYVVVRDKQRLKELASVLPTAQMTANAAFALVPCGDLTKTMDDEGKDFWIQDVSAMSENALLAAHALGLGAVWTGVYPYKQKVNDVRTVLHLPDNIVPLCVIPMGYPTDEPQPKDKWNQNVAFENQWNNKLTLKQ